MSTTQIRETIDRLSSEERFFASAYLHHLAQSDDAAWQQEMAGTQAAMDEGRKFSLGQVQEMHEALASRGL